VRKYRRRYTHMRQFLLMINIKYNKKFVRVSMVEL